MNGGEYEVALCYLYRDKGRSSKEVLEWGLWKSTTWLESRTLDSKNNNTIKNKATASEETW